MDANDLRNIAAVRRMYSGDEAERRSIAPDIVWHVPGHNPVSGDYHGFDEYTRLMPGRMAPLTRWEFEVHDVMVNRSHVVATFTVQGERKGMAIHLRGAHIMRLNDQGQIVEGWGFAENQDALDAFFAA